MTTPTPIPMPVEGRGDSSATRAASGASAARPDTLVENVLGREPTYSALNQPSLPPRLGKGWRVRRQGQEAKARAAVNFRYEVTEIIVTSGGSGYISTPTVEIAPPMSDEGRQATATAVVTDGVVTGFTNIDSGSGYTSVPVVTISGGGGFGAMAVAVVPLGSISSILLDDGGSGYTTAPTVNIIGGGGTGATATARLNGGDSVVSIVDLNGGSGYTSTPLVTFSPQFVDLEGDDYRYSEVRWDLILGLTAGSVDTLMGMLYAVSVVNSRRHVLTDEINRLGGSIGRREFVDFLRKYTSLLSEVPSYYDVGYVPIAADGTIDIRSVDDADKIVEVFFNAYIGIPRPVSMPLVWILLSYSTGSSDVMEEARRRWVCISKWVNEDTIEISQVIGRTIDTLSFDYEAHRRPQDTGIRTTANPPSRVGLKALGSDEYPLAGVPADSLYVVPATKEEALGSPVGREYFTDYSTMPSISDGIFDVMVTDEIEINDAESLIFGGVTALVDHKVNGLHIEGSVSAQDYTALLAKVYTNTDIYRPDEYDHDGDAIRQIFTVGFRDPASQSGTIDESNSLNEFNVQAPPDGFVEDGRPWRELTVNRTTLDQAMNQVAGRSTYEWFVDYLKNIHYYQYKTILAPYSLTDGSVDTHLDRSLRISDASMPPIDTVARRYGAFGPLYVGYGEAARSIDVINTVNVIEVIGANAPSDSLTKVYGNTRNETRIFVELGWIGETDEDDALPIVRVNPNVSDDTPANESNWREQSLAIEGTDESNETDVAWNPEERLMIFKTAPPAIDNSFSVSGRYEVRITARKALPNIRQKVGRWYWHKIYDTSITTRVEAELRLDQERRERQFGGVQITCKTWTPGFRSGQRVSFTNAVLGLTEYNFVIERMDISFQGGGQVEYLLTLREPFILEDTGDIYTPADQDGIPFN